jgi:hypothetical protein
MYTEETAPPGLWKSEIVALLGLAVIASAFVVPPGPERVYSNWLLGLIAGNIAINMAGNRKWERPLAAGAAIWLFISGFVPSVVSGQPALINDVAVGVALIVASISANIHLRDDIRHERPLTL